MKKIVLGIKHLAHLNFFKNAILDLDKEDYEIIIYYLDRGKIEDVLKKEYPPHIPKYKIGSYYNSVFGKARLVLEKTQELVSAINKHKPDLISAVGDFIFAYVSKLFSIKNVFFYDDYEYKINYRLTRLFGDYIYVPFPLPQQKKIIRYRGFKELAYLHPYYYKPNQSALKEYGLTENNYIFIREVAGVSLNYRNLEETNLLDSIKYLYRKGFKMILSLEDKSLKELYDPYCLILEEPVEDIYSIISYARFCMSSGDSMARESALLGVPCIYSGRREMMINKPLIKWGGIIKADNKNEIIRGIDKLKKTQYKDKWSSFILRLIEKEFVDTTKVIIYSIKKII